MGSDLENLYQSRKPIKQERKKPGSADAKMRFLDR